MPERKCAVLRSRLNGRLEIYRDTLDIPDGLSADELELYRTGLMASAARKDGFVLAPGTAYIEGYDDEDDLQVMEDDVNEASTEDVSLTDRDVATILAALRYWQEENLQGGNTPCGVHFEDCTPLTYAEVDALCEHIAMRG